MDKIDDDIAVLSSHLKEIRIRQQNLETKRLIQEAENKKEFEMLKEYALALETLITRYYNVSKKTISLNAEPLAIQIATAFIRGEA